VNRATSATDTVSSTPVDILTNTITIGILSIPNADVTQRLMLATYGVLVAKQNSINNV
jgi:hypothetical protein